MTIEISAYLAALAVAMLSLLVVLLVVAFRVLAGVGGVREVVDGVTDSLPAQGQMITPFAVSPLNAAAAGILQVPYDGRRTMVLVAEPTCTTCQAALTILDAELETLTTTGVGVVVVTTEDSRYVAGVPAFEQSHCPIVGVTPTVVKETFGTTATPLLCSVDEELRFVASTREVSQTSVHMMARRSPELNLAHVEGHGH